VYQKPATPISATLTKTKDLFFSQHRKTASISTVSLKFQHLEKSTVQRSYQTSGNKANRSASFFKSKIENPERPSTHLNEFHFFRPRTLINL
jgi:hypothetical protein